MQRGNKMKRGERKIYQPTYLPTYISTNLPTYLPTYRLLPSDVPRITFVQFAGVDDVVVPGVDVISTQEGTYPTITVTSFLSLYPPLSSFLSHAKPPSFCSFRFFFRIFLPTILCFRVFALIRSHLRLLTADCLGFLPKIAVFR